jgi:hypothetical protein
MLEKKFNKHLELFNGKVVHEFKNEYGEKFVVYKYEIVPAYMITGDEFDWEEGWMMQKGDMDEAICIFQFNQKERDELRKFWDKTLSEEKAKFEASHKKRKQGVANGYDLRKVEDGDKSTKNKKGKA